MTSRAASRPSRTSALLLAEDRTRHTSAQRRGPGSPFTGTLPDRAERSRAFAELTGLGVILACLRSSHV